jgi:hypothetical protein
MAALANDTARKVFAELVLSGDDSPTLLALAPSRRRHVIRVLTGSGLVAEHGGTLSVDAGVFSRMLAVAPARAQSEGLERFFTDDGRVAVYPANKRLRGLLLSMIAARTLQPDEVVSEREINERLSRFADDVALLRRHLVDYGAIERNRSGSRYALIPIDREVSPASSD